MDAKLQDPAMITLEAVKSEYTLALARLQLSRDFPELTGTGEAMTTSLRTSVTDLCLLS